MGELIGTAVEGTLYWISRAEFDRVRRLNAERPAVLSVFADMARLNALYMIANAGSGHIGSSFSSMDLLAHLGTTEMERADGGIYFSSKGHDAPALYTLMIAAGDMSEDLLHRLRRLDGLPGHPDVKTNGIVANTGSLGMGISKAKGMIAAHKLAGRPVRAFVLTGDGELQEGQIWESLVSAANAGLGELTVVIDHNKIQSDYSLERTSSLGDLVAKFEAFGWHVERIDGHDTAAIARTFERLAAIKDRPKIVVADTIKGKGVSFMEGASIDSDVEAFKFHSGAPQAGDYTRGVQEILDRVNRALDRLGSPALAVETTERAPTPAAPAAARLIPAYTEALLEAAARHRNLVALDADLILDMGLIPFRDKYPERFIECGIAEQDMVSQAGGLALAGGLPVVHSFSCFLTTRANEQIYNNATEGTRIVYVGGLSGLIPAGPGHSHQSVREISAIGGVPGLVMAAPCAPNEVGSLLDWCLQTHKGPSFLRLVSVPVALPYSLPDDYRPRVGRGVLLREGADAAIISSGPVMLAQAWRAAEALDEAGHRVAVYNLPWLNVVDEAWLKEAVAGKRLLVTLDDHYLAGGQGEKIMAAIARIGLGGLNVLQLGLTEVPPSGQTDEVLAAVGLDAAAVAAKIRAALAG